MNSEQRNQLLLCLNALERDFYHPLGEIRFSGFTASSSLTLPQAAAQARHPVAEGDVIAQPWGYGWLFADFTLPQSAAGERIVMSLCPGGESTLYVNGRPFGTHRAAWIAIPHHLLVDQTLCARASGGERFTLAAEVYGGTPLPEAPFGRCATGPVFPEEGVRIKMPLPAAVGRSSFGLWNEEAYQLWLDVHMLLDIWETQEESSFLREKIGYALGDMLNRLDLEQPLAARRAACAQAREALRPLMQARNGSFAPSMAAIANSHLDLAWLWPTAETERKTIRTFAQQLRLLEEYPEMLFLQSQCALYEMCRQREPQLFEDIRAAIARGQWIADGAMWVEPDTNLAGGEALIRQFLYGLRYFRQELGADSRIAWLPDSFGYSAALPQIIHGFGLEGLTTQKIFWTYNDAEKFPFHAFSWKGLDGTQIPCYLHMAYESFVDAKTLNRRWRERLNRDGTGEFLLPFGYGDGGGGPTRDDLEQLRRERDLQGVPRMHFESPADFLQRRAQSGLPVYRGELYFQCHRGTYTSQAAIKAGNRRSEQALRALELWRSAASMCGAAPYPSAEIEALWKDALFNQFHDILPGSAIGQVYVEANARYARLLSRAQALTQEGLDALSGTAPGVTLYHAQSVERTQLVALDARFARGAVTCEGEAVPCMPCGDGALALVSLPPMGHVSLRPAEDGPAGPAACAQRHQDGWLLANDRLEAVLSPRGELLGVRDRRTGAQRLGGVSNRLHLYRDVPRAYDAWDVDSQVFDRECFPEISAKSEAVLSGGLRASVRFTLTMGSSTFIQTISLDADACRIDFDTQADWHERHKLLKTSFDTGIDAPEAANQIQFGHIMRPTHRSHPYDADRYEVCNHAFTALYDATHGCALLNDCKYGVSMDRSTLSLSLLRGSVSPDEAADQGAHRFRYAVFFWDGAFEDSGVVYEAGALNVPVCTAEGFLPRASLFSCTDPRAVIDAVKLAEDGSGDVIVRLYESMGGQRRTRLHVPGCAVAAWRCALSEERQQALPLEDGAVCLELHPFEIATVRLALGKPA